jgi:phospholipid transport system substrate-binding protein
MPISTVPKTRALPISFPQAFAALSMFLLALTLAPNTSRAADASAMRFVTEFGNTMLNLVKTQQGSPDILEKRMRPLVLDAFDVPRIARFALGSYWGGLSADERSQFTHAFEDYVVHVYARRFAGYRGESFSVTSARSQGASAALVASEITRPEAGSPIKLVWQVNRVGEHYKIVDVSVEGISQALTYRDEFASVIEHDGGRVSNLISELREKAKA